MVKKLVATYYFCEICNYRYEDKDSAQQCESYGKAVELPIGLMYGDHRRDAFYSNITFAVAGNKLDGHTNRGGSWATRDNPYGDSLGQETCGSPNGLNMNECYGNLDINHPTFGRMVKWLQRQAIPITVWDGTKPVSLEDYKKLYAERKKADAS